MEQKALENQRQSDTTMPIRSGTRAEWEAMNKKIDEIHKLADKTYKLFLWTMIATVVMFVLPLIFLAFAIPYLMRTITSGLGGL